MGCSELVCASIDGEQENGAGLLERLRQSKTNHCECAVLLAGVLVVCKWCDNCAYQPGAGSECGAHDADACGVGLMCA